MSRARDSCAACWARDRLVVAREAILPRNDTHSFTEIGYTAFARIERARHPDQ